MLAGIDYSPFEVVEIIHRSNLEIDKANAIIASKNAEISRLEARIAKLKEANDKFDKALAIEKAHAMGLEAYLNEFKKHHPNSPVMADSGKRFKKSGNIKTKGRLVYEAVFDKVAREHGIERPTDYRVD